MSNNIYSILSIVIFGVNILFIITAVFLERKKPVQALGWVLLLILLPVVGFILYFIFGRAFNFKKKRFHIKCDKDQKQCLEIYRILDCAYYDESAFKEPFNDNIKQLIKFNINTSNSPFTGDNKVTIFTSADDKYRELLNDIEAAKSSIHFLYYIIQNDNIGKKIVQALAKKAKEGVEVRVLFDHGSNLVYPFKAYKEILDNGGEVLSFFSTTINNYLRINFRNHRKIVVIDGSLGYIGGINIGDEYLGLRKETSPWRDTHLKIVGSSVYSLQLRFMADWLFSSNKDVQFGDIEKYFISANQQEAGNTGVQISASGPDTNGEEIKRSMIKMINHAKKSVLIQTPYFIPDGPFLEALQNAALSGIDVIIQLPAKPDQRFVYKATMSYVADVIKYGIKVYLYPGFLHAKMMVVDNDCCAIGSANIDVRSFALNFEINAFMFGEEISQRCVKIFNDDLALCTLLTKDIYNNRSTLSKIEENVFRLLSPIL